jgi:adenylate kinase
MLRSARARGTPTGLLAKPYMDRGELVPDEVVDALVEERLKELPNGSAFLLDGYPRNASQAEALARLLQRRGTPLTAVLYLDVDDETIVRRIRGRGEGRPDDREDVVRERLRVYRAATAPLVDLYAKRGLLRRIDGRGSIGDVRRAVFEALGEKAP